MKKRFYRKIDTSSAYDVHILTLHTERISMDNSYTWYI